ncbi:hypothetical protein OG762_39325 [Streptomyces sp. NBC_01136]|uniref:hypothetical protein n=1 Tax=Streptomyces sp. NBC_01136 TaxID=2903754 RepID=UPI00386F61AE|nr:hypothetical protein OG762_39325 [Streptomyces sp. NBC_01136]
MGRLLVVPVHLDALCLAGERQVTEPFTDFTRLPYRDPADGHDHQADMPYVSETLLSVPFQDQGFRLKAGVHLHWSLPDALTRLAASQDAAGAAPVVPNRWLVTRSAGGAVAQQWVVESDFLAEDNAGGVPYPYIADQMDGPERLPYRLLGRRVPLTAWQPAGRTGSADPADRARYLRALTAVGYGEPAFASFYPHCHSVFGLHDPAFQGVPPQDVTYDVLGWYEDPGQDALAAALGAPRDAGTGWPDVLRAAFGWTAADSGAGPDRMVCWGRIAFAPGAQELRKDIAVDDTGVWVGNTPTEALAAHLGAVLGDTGLAADDLENLLEALAFAEELESAPLDVGLKLLEARHADTFRAVPSGNLWTVTDDRAGQGADADLTALPRAAGAALNTLNAAQAACDRAGAELTGLRQELYADWYRYMLCVYPPDTSRDSYPNPDQVLFHLRRQAALITRRAARAEALGQDRDAARAAAETVLPDGYRLLPGPAPQYYLPNEPVVLLTGPAATPSDRFGQDGLLECQVTDGDIPADAEAVRALRDTVAGLPALAAHTRAWETQPWHPLLLQWEAEFFPAGPNGNLNNPADRDFHTDFITATYTLSADQAELRPRAAGGAVLAKAANVYTGAAVLSPSARPLLAARILRYLAKPVLAALDGAVTEDAFTADPEPALDRFLASGKADQRAVTLVAVYRHLAANEQNNLAQALGGFDDALLMRRLARQLPVADPLGFPDHRTVTETEVAPAVAGESRYTPQPLSDFNPIRAGAMRLLRLRMVDTFGTVRDIPVETVGTTTQLRVEGHPSWVDLPPRLAQPARLSLRWLDADSDLAEMNAVPATSPVCGWLLANHLDGSVAVHAADGSALGAVYALPGDPGPAGVPALWQPAPGRAPVPVDGIGNPHLRAVVARLRDLGPDGVAAFLGTLDQALAAIEPEDYALNRNRALLVSRPVAVTRATVSLELAGRPAVHQDWNVFRQDLRRSGCESNGFTRVRFPVRLGDHGRLGDGLVGYWPEEPDGRLGPVLHSVTDGDETEDAALFQAIDAPVQALTMLVDPRGAVHACCGILPAKSLRIPDAHYRDALGAMEIAFLTAPVLGDGTAAAPDLPLPDEPGFVWCWLERDVPSGTGWLRTGSEPLIDRAAVLAAFPDEAALWRQLADAGWLAPLDDDTALVTPAEQRPPLPTALAGHADAFTALLERPALAQPRQDASFAARPTAREGWLTLRPRPTTNANRQ